MSLVEIAVDVQRPARSGDGSGGKTISWAVVEGMSALVCTRNFYGRTSQLVRLEQAAHNTQGPGVGSKTNMLYLFREQPFPEIKVGDRLLDTDGVAWLVLWPPRVYELTMQVDTELVA